MFTWCHSDLVTFHLAAPHDLFIGPVLNIYFVGYFRETIRDMGIWVEKVMEINLKGKQTQGILGFIMQEKLKICFPGPEYWLSRATVRAREWYYVWSVSLRTSLSADPQKKSKSMLSFVHGQHSCMLTLGYKGHSP